MHIPQLFNFRPTKDIYLKKLRIKASKMGCILYFLHEIDNPKHNVLGCLHEILATFVGIEFSPVLEIGVSKGHISPKESTAWNTTFELYLALLLLECNQ